MGLNLFVISTFFAAIFCVVALYSLASDVLFRDRQKLRSRIEEELRGAQRARAKSSMLREMSQADLHQLIDASEDHRTWHEKIRDMLDQAAFCWPCRLALQQLPCRSSACDSSEMPARGSCDLSWQMLLN